MTYTVLAVVSAIDLPFQISLELAEREQARAFVFADPAVGDLVDGDGIEVVQLLAPAPECRHEIRFLQNSEMLGDRLAVMSRPLQSSVNVCRLRARTLSSNCRLTGSASARKTSSMPMQANMQLFGCLFRREMAALRRSGLLACDPGGFEYRTDSAASVGLASGLSPRAGAGRRDIRNDAGGRGTRARAGSRSASRREARPP